MKKSFTLLEMLVVIGIIAILVSMGFASYSTVQKKARNAKRQGDLKAAQQVLEQCYSVNPTPFEYPVVSVSSGTVSASCPGSSGLSFSIIDPLNTTPYAIPTAATSAYKITATLEEGETFSVSNQQ